MSNPAPQGQLNPAVIWFSLISTYIPDPHPDLDNNYELRMVDWPKERDIEEDYELLL